MKVNLIKNHRCFTGQKELKELLEEIRKGTWKKEIEAIRRAENAGDTAAAEKLKAQLTAFPVSAYYRSRRVLSQIQAYYPLLVLDYDHVEPALLPLLKERLGADMRVMLAAVSPRGKGLKIIVRTPGNPEGLAGEPLKALHLHYFRTLSKHYNALLGLQADESGKDIGRIMYVTYDPQAVIRYNEQAAGLPLPIASQPSAQGPANPLLAKTGKDIPAQSKEMSAPVRPTHARSRKGPAKTFPQDAGETCPAGEKTEDQEKWYPERDFPPAVTLLPASQAPGLQDKEQARRLFRQQVRAVSKRSPYMRSNRNIFLFQLACRLHQQGLPPEQAREFCLEAFDYPADELDALLKSAYSYAPSQPEATPAGRQKKNDPQRQADINTVEFFINQRYSLRYNTVLAQLEFRPADDSQAPFVPMSDLHINSVYRALQKEGIPFNLNTLYALLHSDFVSPFDPFEAYFDSLAPWDGVTDYIGPLAGTVTTTRPDYWERCLRKWLVAMVAGWLRPGVVNHTMLVLIGAQGTYKTTWCLNLIPAELARYRYSGIVNAHSKDSLLTLAQCGLINNEELENMSAADLNAFKALLTLSVINERLPYGRTKEYLRRRASFIGSGNHKEILTDLTGNRRWLCFEALDIRPPQEHSLDHAGLYAQLKHLLDEDFTYWFDREECALLNRNNEAFEVKSVEEEQICTWFRLPQPGEKGVRLTAAQVMQKLMQWIHVPMNVTLVGRTLKKLGYKQTKQNGARTYHLIERTFEEVEALKKDLPDQI